MESIEGVWSKERERLIVIAGLCVLEEKKVNEEVAAEVKRVAESLPVWIVFKASFDKANRTSLSSYRGPGIVKGLEILCGLREKFGIPVLTDIHTPEQAEVAGKAADILQVPAFLCRQTDLLLAAGKEGRGVNIKKGQFLSPREMERVVEKVESTGNRNILVTERGTIFGYNNLIVDFTAIPVMKGFGYPVLLDATHSLQMPGGRGERSGGRGELIPLLARTGIAAGVDGLFLEVHPEPARAKSDAENSLPLKSLFPLLKRLCKLRALMTPLFSEEESISPP